MVNQNVKSAQFLKYGADTKLSDKSNTTIDEIVKNSAEPTIGFAAGYQDFQTDLSTKIKNKITDST